MRPARMATASGRLVQAALSVAVLLVGAKSTVARAEAGARYVALGSSYSAGPGVGQPDLSSGRCARSLSNFARIVAARRHLDLVDASCAGATTANVLRHGQYEPQPQMSYVTPAARYVSVLIGGNDIDYVGNLGGLSCRDTGGVGCHVADAAAVEGKLAALPAALDAVVAEIRHRAPAARIVLIGYLPAIPAAGPGSCTRVPLSTTDAARMRGIAIRLAQIIGGAAERDRVGVVRSTELGQGHDACSFQPFVAGYHPARQPGWPAPVPYHPTQAGMDAVAASLDQAFGR